MESCWVKNLLSFSSKAFERGWALYIHSRNRYGWIRRMSIHGMSSCNSRSRMIHGTIGNGSVRVCKYNRPRSLCHLISPICTRSAANDHAILASHALLSYYSDLCPFQRTFLPCLLAMRLQFRKPSPWIGILAHASSLHALIPLASSERYVAHYRETGWTWTFIASSSRALEKAARTSSSVKR